MSTADTGALLSILGRRTAVLRTLLDDPRDKPDLVGALGVSRSTVDRAVRELEGAALIERIEDGYCPTAFGRLALAEYERFAERAASVSDCAAVLSALPPDVPLDAAMVVDAEVVLSERSSPQRPVERLYELVSNADRVRGFAPAVIHQQVAVYHERIVQSGMDTELVLTDDVVRQLLSNHEDRFQEALASGHLEVWETGTSFPYGVTIAEQDGETRVGLMAYVEDGIGGFIHNDTDAAVEWAEERFAARRERANALSPGEMT